MKSRLGILEIRCQLEKRMHKDVMNLDVLFTGAIPLMHMYTRAQAIADGVLVDVTKTATDAGFRVPVAITAAVWDMAVAWSDADSARQTPQDESGRLWDVVWISYDAARRASGSGRVPVQLHVVRRNGVATRPRLMTLHMVIGPGDKGEPVITIMNPGED